MKKKVEKWEAELWRLAEIKKKEDRKAKKMKDIIAYKEKFFLERMEGVNLAEKKTKKNNAWFNVRVYWQRGSDGLMNIKFDKIVLWDDLNMKIS